MAQPGVKDCAVCHKMSNIGARKQHRNARKPALGTHRSAHPRPGNHFVIARTMLLVKGQAPGVRRRPPSLRWRRPRRRRWCRLGVGALDGTFDGAFNGANEGSHPPRTMSPCAGWRRAPAGRGSRASSGRLSGGGGDLGATLTAKQSAGESGDGRAGDERGRLHPARARGTRQGTYRTGDGGGGRRRRGGTRPSSPPRSTSSWTPTGTERTLRRVAGSRSERAGPRRRATVS